MYKLYNVCLNLFQVNDRHVVSLDVGDRDLVLTSMLILLETRRPAANFT